MTFIKSELHLIATPPGKFTLTRELSFYSQKRNITVNVPIGFVTDFASIPIVARVFINRNGLSRKAAVIHDYLYKYHKVSRDQADTIFLEAMHHSGVGFITRSLMYRAVRIAGWMFYEKNKA